MKEEEFDFFKDRSKESTNVFLDTIISLCFITCVCSLVVFHTLPKAPKFSAQHVPTVTELKQMVNSQKLTQEELLLLKNLYKTDR